MASHWFHDYLPLLGAIGMQFSLAGTTLLAKWVMRQGVSPTVFITYRQAAASLFLVPTTLIARRGKRNPAMGIKGFSLVFLAALLGITSSQFLYYKGIEFTTASAATAVTNTIPAQTFLLAVCIGLERVEIRNLRSMAKVFGTTTCVGGAIFLALFKGKKILNTEFQTLQYFFNAIGEDWMTGCLLIFGCSCFGLIWLILQVPICEHYLDPLSLTTWMCTLGSFQLAILTFFIERDFRVWTINSWFLLLVAMYVGIIGSGVTYYVQSWIISRKGPVFIATFNPLSTVIVAILASIFLHEELYFGSLIGATAIVVGLYIVLWGKAKDFDKKEESYRSENYTRETISTNESTQSSDIEEPLVVV